MQPFVHPPSLDDNPKNTQDPVIFLTSVFTYTVSFKRGIQHGEMKIIQALDSDMGGFKSRFCQLLLVEPV